MRLILKDHKNRLSKIMDDFQIQKPATTATTATTNNQKCLKMKIRHILLIKKVVAGSSRVVAGSSRMACYYRVVAEKGHFLRVVAVVVAVVAVVQEIRA
jgi:hypothetical protein